MIFKISCRSKFVWLSFFCRTKKRVFWSLFQLFCPYSGQWCLKNKTKNIGIHWISFNGQKQITDVRKDKEIQWFDQAAKYGASCVFYSICIFLTSPCWFHSFVNFCSTLYKSCINVFPEATFWGILQKSWRTLLFFCHKLKTHLKYGTIFHSSNHKAEYTHGFEKFAVKTQEWTVFAKQCHEPHKLTSKQQLYIKMSS